MKRLALLISILMLLSLAACTGERPVPTPTAAPTSLPTAEPTEEPTAAPTASPTEVPDFSGLIPATGKLCEGPIFPGPAKYVVIKGESDNFYVYDNMGELVNTFKAVADEYAFGGPGFYGEDGICENVRILTGEKLPPFYLFGDCFYFIDEDWENASFRLKCVKDIDYNTLFEFSDGEAPELGMGGGVLHIGDEFWILNRDYDWDNDYPVSNAGDILVYNESGKLVRRVDPSPFGHITGLFGGRYIIGGVQKDGADDDYYGFDCSLFDLNGNKVMEHVQALGIDYFAIEDEAGYGMLSLSEFVKDKAGHYYNADLEQADEVPDDYFVMSTPAKRRYGNLSWIMENLGWHAAVWGGTYSGVRRIGEDLELGEWTFRIYSPTLANDNDNERY